MNVGELMSGIGVVIDDAFGSADRDDLIFRIAKQIEEQWNLALYTTERMPPEETWAGLLRSASFVLLDWQLWRGGAARLEQDGMERNIQFLTEARKHFIPVFIFTNESADDVIERLPDTIFQKESPEKNFVFIRNKAGLVAGDSLDFSDIEQWIRKMHRCTR